MGIWCGCLAFVTDEYGKDEFPYVLHVGYIPLWSPSEANFFACASKTLSATGHTGEKTFFCRRRLTDLIGHRSPSEKRPHFSPELKQGETSQATLRTPGARGSHQLKLIRNETKIQVIIVRGQKSTKLRHELGNGWWRKSSRPAPVDHSSKTSPGSDPGSQRRREPRAATLRQRPPRVWRPVGQPHTAEPAASTL